MRSAISDREAKLYLVFIDVFAWQVFLYNNIPSMNAISKTVFLLFFAARMVFDYVIMFFLWSNKRVEEYSEKYESNGMLMFFIVFLVQNVINILYVLGLVSRKYAFIALAIYIFSFSWGRVKYQFGNNVAKWDEQFKADVSILLMLECLNMFCTWGLMTVISSTQKFVCSMIIIMLINISSSVMTYGKRNKVFLWKEKYIRYEILCLLFYSCEIVAGILYKWVVPDSDKSIVLIIFVLIQMLIYMAILKWGTDAYRKSLYDKVKGEM